jgi:hypothetical protein
MRHIPSAPTVPTQVQRPGITGAKWHGAGDLDLTTVKQAWLTRVKEALAAAF